MSQTIYPPFLKQATPSKRANPIKFDAFPKAQDSRRLAASKRRMQKESRRQQQK